MSYCALQDIKEIIPEITLVQLTDDDQTGEIDINKIDEAISYSQQIIDGYLRGRYELPLNRIPGVIKILSTDLAFYRLYSRRFDTDMPESIQDKYKNSVRILTQIQKGQILLDLDFPEQVPVLHEFKTNKVSEDRVFSKDRLNNF